MCPVMSLRHAAVGLLLAGLQLAAAAAGNRFAPEPLNFAADVLTDAAAGGAQYGRPGVPDAEAAAVPDEASLCRSPPRSLLVRSWVEARVEGPQPATVPLRGPICKSWHTNSG